MHRSPIGRAPAAASPFSNFTRPAAWAAALAATLTAGWSAAQSPVDGYTHDLRALPPSSTTALQLGPDTVYFDGFGLVLDQGGPAPTLLLSTGAVFASFAIPIDGQRLLFGESSNGNLWIVPLTGPAPSAPLATVPFNYGATLLDANTAVVSAKTGGFGTPDNQLLSVDLSTGQTVVLGSLPGASGPVLATAGGGLLYATATQAFPAPAGTADILHWPPSRVAAARAGGPALDATNAMVLISGLDAVASLALDGDGDLLFTDWFQNRVGEVDGLFGPNPRAKTLMTFVGTGISPTNVQFVGGLSWPDFEPYQDDLGGALYVSESDFVSVHQLRRVRAQRAQIRVAQGTAVPPGPFTVDVVDGAPGGTAFLVVSLLAPAPFEQRLAVPGFEQALGWNPASTAPLLSVFAPLGAGGTASWVTANPGLGSFGISVQAAFANGAVDTIGSTPAISITLQ